MLAYIKILPYLGLGVALVSGYLWIKNKDDTIVALKDNLKIMAANQVLLEETNANNLMTIETLRHTQQKMLENISTLEEANRQVEKEKQEYLDVFRNDKFIRTAKAKPELVTRLMNRETARLFRSLEEETDPEKANE